MPYDADELEDLASPELALVVKRALGEMVRACKDSQKGHSADLKLLGEILKLKDSPDVHVSAPSVTAPVTVNVPETARCSWKFQVSRDEHGRIDSLTATPV